MNSHGNPNHSYRKEPIRTLVVDHSPLALHAICSFLDDMPGVQVVGTTTDGLEALALAASLQPDLALLDMHIPPLNGFRNGLDLASRFAEAFPAILVVMVTVFETSGLEQGLAHRGAYGTVSKQRMDEELPVLLDRIHRSLRASNDSPDQKTDS
jgi:DNA-binding NarL/FixJ family response regulator